MQEQRANAATVLGLQCMRILKDISSERAEKGGIGKMWVERESSAWYISALELEVVQYKIG